MTTFTTGTINNNPNGSAYSVALGETLIIQQGAALIGSGLLGNNRAVWLQGNDQVYNVSVDGAIIGTGSAGGQTYLGLVLDNPNPNVSNSTVTVGSSGSIYGRDYGIYAAGRANISNFGSISSSGDAVFANAGGDYAIINTGTISSTGLRGLDLVGGGTHTITNQGWISGITFAIYTGGDANTSVESLTNSGTISGSVDLGGGNDVVHSEFGIINGTVTLGSGNDEFYGTRFGDVVLGGAGDDKIDGGGGVDTMTGGLGNDTYVVDDANDTITEIAGIGEGFADLVRASVSYTLAANLSVELLVAADSVTTTPLILIGNELTQTITGNAGDNLIDGGFDTLVDTLAGGAGNDTYVLHFAVADSITDSSGNDTIASSKNVSLLGFSQIENLLLTGIDPTNGTGDGNANKITGNIAANILDGGAGADQLIGGTGSDTYIVDQQGDAITELTGEGTTDTVQISASYALGSLAEIEVMMTANALAATAINLTGNNFKQTIIGNNGNNVLSGLGGDDTLTAANGSDTLFGGLGNDTLTGGAGTDFFVFNTALNAATNKDTIQDFNVVADTMRLENTGAGLFNALALGTLAAAAFVKGAGFVSAKDATDRIVYNTTTGDLYYDKDGIGGAAAVKFATLANHAAITNADFLII